MNESLKNITETNRRAWNETMPKHQAAMGTENDELFSIPGYIYVEEPEVLDLFEKVGIAGKDIVHLCCNNGSELMSLKNMGARRCVGVDISDVAIIEASGRAARCGIDVEFIQANVYELPESLHKSFDILHVTAGGLGWLPDLKQFFASAVHLLRPNGIVLLHEMHPFGEMLPFDTDIDRSPLEIVEPYFYDEPIFETSSLDYIGGTSEETSGQYWKVHTISDILMGLINAGLAIEEFHEYPRDISAGHSRQEDLNAGIPLSYLLVGKKL